MRRTVQHRNAREFQQHAGAGDQVRQQAGGADTQPEQDTQHPAQGHVQHEGAGGRHVRLYPAPSMIKKRLRCMCDASAQCVMPLLFNVKYRLCLIFN